MKKLEIELVPTSLWRMNLREFLTSSSWDKVRKECYKNAGYKCEICGGKGTFGKGHPVECHEIWEYDDENKIQNLRGVIALCPPCHKTKHFGLSSLKGWTDLCKNQLKKVNGWDNIQMIQHINQSFSLQKQRDIHEWDVNLSWLKSIKDSVSFKPKYKYLEIFFR